MLSLSVLAQSPGDERIKADDIQSVMNDEPKPEAATEAAEPTHIDLLSLAGRGGGFMIPIGLMSLLVVALAAERILSLRESKIVPQTFVNEVRSLARPSESFNPNLAYHICEDFPSPASNAIRAMLMRTGQPLGEIENAAMEAIQREADEHAAPIRWLNLAAAATPLMGLLGTVWGMIVAFHESTTLTADRSRSEQLSEGIYTALVTTLAGLIVAIPAAMFAQYLENRLAKLFNRIEELAFELSPSMAQFVGRRRLDDTGTMRSMETSKTNSEIPSPPTASTPPIPPAPPKVHTAKRT